MKATGEEEVEEVSPRHVSEWVDPKQLNGQEKTTQDVIWCGETNPLARWFGTASSGGETTLQTRASSMTGHRCRITAIRGDSWRMRNRRQKTKQMSEGLI